MKKTDSLDQLELKISKFLRAGVVLSGLVMLIGWLPQLTQGENFTQFKEYHPLSLMYQLTQDFQQHRWGTLTCYVGLVILISLPLIRVLLTAFLFMKQGERVLAAIASFVFLSLIVSFMFGIQI